MYLSIAKNAPRFSRHSHQVRQPATCFSLVSLRCGGKFKKIIRNDRKIQILQALHECMLEKPFHQTSIKDIAKKADVNHGLLHYYFENKEDILLNYIDFTFDKYSAIFST